MDNPFKGVTMREIFLATDLNKNYRFLLMKEKKIFKKIHFPRNLLQESTFSALKEHQNL